MKKNTLPVHLFCKQKHILKFFNVMKLSTLGLFACAFAAYAVDADAQAAKINVSNSRMTIGNFIEQVEEETGYMFVYNKREVDLNRTVSLEAGNSSVADCLNRIFENSGITYVFEDDYIVLTKRTKDAKATLIVQQSGKTIKGVITDEAGLSVVGANVIVKGTTIGTVTDVDGNFSIEVPSDDAVLVISYIGYMEQEIPVKRQKSWSIVLKEDSQSLDEVVVVGYGTQKKIDLTGAVTSVKMDDVIGNRPIGSAAQALESTVPGLQISRNNGKPGVSMNMNIRGVTSTNNSDAAPLVLVDNVPMDINMIDPSDIESVSVLKDAASAAIYGARAAFGIILITTKQGKRETPVSFNYSNNFAFSNPMSLPNKVNPRQTVQVYKDLGSTSHFGGQNIELWRQYLDEYAQGMYHEGYVVNDGVRYSLQPTDAYEDMMDRFGFQQQHNLSMQGGTKNANYRLAFGMVDEDGVLYGGNDTYRRYNVSSFINMDVTKWLSGQLDFRYSDSNTLTAKGNREGGANIWQVAHQAQPMAPLGYGYPVNDETQGLLPYFSPRNMLSLDSPSKDRKSDTRVLGRFILRPVENLSVTGEYSFYRQWGTNSYAPKIYQGLLQTSNNKVPSRTKNFYETKEWFSTTNAINVYATYELNFLQDHNVKAMAGFNQESYHYEERYSKREDLIDQDLPSLSTGSGVQTTKDAFSEYALRSGFFRLNYDYKNRYLLTFNGRYDGSSRFGKDNRFGFFPSFSAGWRVSEESFMESVKEIVSNLKPRISWGSIGNQNVSNYGYMSAMDIDKNHDIKWILPGESDYVLTVKKPGLVSSYYTWETVETLNVGVDMGLLNNQLQMNFDWYQRDTKNMLAPYRTAPSVLGAGYPNTNSASLRTNGWELTVNWNGKIGQDIRYNLGLNLYDSRSKITRYENSQGILEDDGKLVLREGMEYGEIWGYTTDRFYTEADFDENGKLKDGIPYVEGVTKPNPGDILYVDYDGNGIINGGKNTEDEPGDKRVIGNNTPRYQYNINGGISWKNFDLSFILTGVGKRDLWMPGYWCASGTFTEAVYDYQMDYWTEENTNSYWPRLYSAGGNNSANNRIQTKYLRDGSYLRLKNITLGYNLPKQLCSKLYIGNLRFFISGENLYTWHHLPEGYNPDSFVAIPGDLKVTSGIQGDGATNWSYPLMRQFSFGINLIF